MLQDMLKLFISNKKALVGVMILFTFILIAILAPVLAPYHPRQDGTEDRSFPLQADPGGEHILGTNHAGYDILSRLIYGTRLTMFVGLITGFISTFIALTFGLVSGYFGGRIDDILNLINNIFLVIPSLPLIIVIASYIRMRGVLPIILVLTITNWAWGGRLIRSQVMSMREREFIKVAEVMGESKVLIIFREILPNIISLVMVTFFTATLSAVLSHATLEFIGLGDVTVTTWGSMLYWARNSAALLYGAWWWFLPPGIFIGMLGASLAMMNFAIDEISNPKIRER